MASLTRKRKTRKRKRVSDGNSGGDDKSSKGNKIMLIDVRLTQGKSFRKSTSLCLTNLSMLVTLSTLLPLVALQMMSFTPPSGLLRRVVVATSNSKSHVAASIKVEIFQSQ